MKVLGFLVAFSALLATALALKNVICGLPRSANGDGRMSCLAYIPRWTFDSSNNKCISFVYGGCGGNENRFESRKECEEKCLE
ncbi:uncharacterized protein Dana_GF28046 [Drosophila ananassae]|uniref:BPTI/Kunitz inhibitor domain-containing protein n=1 Tax=Drosophila ananassae TaxID=7217 RepID=A0A0P9BN69_DROAN|nr:male accessory gland serine protease inhibitor [Drosophila ananassae]KPU73269.1 uncharacterized protein Dana_GF28046 [Drosophila ananassae]